MMRQQIRSRIKQDALRHIEAFQRSPGEKVGVLAKNLGLVIVEEALGEGIDGYLEYRPNVGSKSGYVIVVNSAHSVERKRWTAAHEIGHFLLHSRVHDVGFGEKRYRGNGAVDVFYSDARDQIEEREANHFAEDLLVEIRALDRAWEQGHRGVIELSRIFWVSQEVIRIRVESLMRFKRKRQT